MRSPSCRSCPAAIPGLPPGPGRPGRVEFEYERHGTVACLAAYDVHRARLMGRIEPTTGIVPFAALADQVMTAEPCASARRVFWVADNGSSHRGQASIDRMAAAWPNAVLVHLPVHASWLNQVEIVFSVIQRKVIKPADLGDAAALAARLTRFQARYNATAKPFDWKFTRARHQDSVLPSGQFTGTPEEVLDCACGLYLGDPGAWLPPEADTPTNLRAGPLVEARRAPLVPQLLPCSPLHHGTAC